MDIHHFKDFLQSPYCGIVSSWDKKPIPPGIPQCHLYTAKIGRSFHCKKGYRDAEPYSSKNMYAAGAGITEKGALRCAMGEAIERYCATMLDYDRIIHAHHDRLDGDRLDPHNWIDHSAKVAAGKQAWLEGHSLEDGRSLWVPASTVWLFNGQTPELSPLVQINSNGLAAGECREEAILGGMCELLERDALMVNWQLKQPLNKIIIDTELLEHIHPMFHEPLIGSHSDVKIELYDMQFESPIPIVLAKLSLVSRPFGMVLGASAKPNLAGAIEKALLETVSVFYSVGPRFLNFGDRVADVNGITSFIDHGLYYADPRNSHQASFLFGEKEKKLQLTRIPTTTQCISTITSHLKAWNIQPCFVDLTTADVRALGLWVVRCLAPGLEPLRMGLPARKKDLRRLQQIADRRKLADFRLNHSMQPFA